MKRWLDGNGGGILNRGDSAGMVFRRYDEHYYFIRELLEASFSEGVRVLLIGNSDNKKDMVSYLEAEGIEFTKEVSEGKIVYPAGFSRCDGELPGNEELIRLLQYETAEAKKAGYPYLLLIADSTCLFGRSPLEDRILEFKSAVDRFIPGKDCIVVLCIDRNQNSAGSLLIMIEYLEKIIFNGRLLKNPCYISPGEVPVKDRQSARVDYLLKNIQSYNENEETLRNKLRLLEERKDQIDKLLPELRKLKDIVNNSPAVAFLWDVKEGWPVIFVSQNISHFGYNPSDFYSGKLNFSDIIHPDDIERVNSEVKRYTEEGRSEYNQEYRLIIGNGKVRWVEDRTIVHRDNFGDPVMYEGVLMDITESKELEEELRLSNKKYSTLFAINPNPILICSLPEGTITELNDRFVELMGISRNELAGKTITDLNFYKNPSDRESYISELMNTGRVDNFEVEIFGAGGTDNWVLMSGRLFEIDGKMSSLTLIHDITERKRYEQKLKISSEKFKNTFNSIQDALYIVDRDYNIININKPFLKSLGIGRDEVVGKKCYEVLVGMKEPCDSCPVRVVMETGKPYRSEMSVLIKDESGNRRRDYDILGSPVFNTEGKLILSVLSGRDITEMKGYRSAIEEANRKLNLLSQITRHDILNSLTVSIGYLDLLKDDPSFEFGDYLSKLSSSIDTIKHQIEFTRDYQDMGLAPPIWQNVRPLIKTCSYQGGGLPGDSEFDMNVRNIEIFADPMFEKAICNVISNAYKHASGMKKLKVFEIEENESLKLIFEDDGSGIPAGKKKSIFKPGYGREHGYGLFLVKEILGITGIKISETGEPGKGAKFEFLIPSGKWRLLK